MNNLGKLHLTGAVKLPSFYLITHKASRSSAFLTCLLVTNNLKHFFNNLCLCGSVWVRGKFTYPLINICTAFRAQVICLTP
jgi:hypothetical protein